MTKKKPTRRGKPPSRADRSRHGVEVVDLSALKPDAGNVRTHTPRNIGVIGDLLQEVGAFRSIGVDEDNTVLVGNGVLEAAAERGFKRVMIVDGDGETLVAVRRRGLSKSQKQKAAIGDNRASDLSAFDARALLALKESGVDLAWGWTADELATLSQSIDGGPKAGKSDPDAVPAQRATDIKLGDLFELGQHRLFCGDSTKAEDVALAMGGEKAAMMWTDPPYGVEYTGKTKAKLKVENDGAAGLRALLREAFGVADAALVEGAPVYVAHPAGPLSMEFADAFVAIGWHFHQGLIWVKDTLVLGHSDYHYKHEPLIYGWKPGDHPWHSGRSEVSVFEIDRPKASPDHPTSKPVALVAAHIRNSSVALGIAYDPFCGGGTTLIAAEQLDRRCYAIEIEPTYCQVTIDRWEAFTGQKAKRVD